MTSMSTAISKEVTGKLRRKNYKKFVNVKSQVIVNLQNEMKTWKEYSNRLFEDNVPQVIYKEKAVIIYWKQKLRQH